MSHRHAGALASLALALLGGATARADEITYDLQDIGAFPGRTDSDTSATFRGTGFVGLYSPQLGLGFGHVFGLESTITGVSQSRTALEVDLSALAGTSVTSATLSFVLQGGAGEAQQVTATSFAADGTLGYYFNPPDALASETYTVQGRTSNTLDVTSLLNQSLADGQNWFGLVLSGGSQDEYTSTFANGDSAAVVLTIETDPVAAPEPATLGMFAVGGLLLLAYARRRKAQALLTTARA